MGFECVCQLIGGKNARFVNQRGKRRRISRCSVTRKCTKLKQQELKVMKLVLVILLVRIDFICGFHSFSKYLEFILVGILFF